MLGAGRFNCFLRSVGEVASDLKRRQTGGFTVEKHLLFSYQSTSLFFVNKENTRLATRLELGLRRAVLDGSFSKYFRETYARELK